MMLKLVLLALAIAAPTYGVAADIDMTSISCHGLFFDQPPERRENVVAMNMQWFSGYYHGAAGLTAIDTEKQNKLSMSVGQYCGLHRQEKVIDVYGRFFREIYQGKRADL